MQSSIQSSALYMLIAGKPGQYRLLNEESSHAAMNARRLVVHKCS